MYLTLEEVTAAWKSGAITGEQFLVLKHEFTSRVADVALAEAGAAPALAPAAKFSSAGKAMLALGAAGMAAGVLAAGALSHHARSESTSAITVISPDRSATAAAAAYRFGLARPAVPQALASPGAARIVHLGRIDFAAQRQLKVTLAREQAAAREAEATPQD